MTVLYALLAAALHLQPLAEPEAAVGSWPDERALADGFGVGLAGGSKGCIAKAENRKLVTDLLSQGGHAISARSENSPTGFTVRTVPKLHFGRLIYHYVSVGEALCVSGFCLSSYAGRIELPVTSDGRGLPSGAVSDPDRTTLALFEAVETIGRRCGSGA